MNKGGVELTIMAFSHKKLPEWPRHPDPLQL